jgi:hypothetical protein
MTWMRLTFLVVLMPAVAFADASTPDKPPPPSQLTVGDRAVTVGFGPDWKIHVRVTGGGELVLEPAGQAYVARDVWNVSAEVVAKGVPVPLVKVSSRPEACSDFWDIYVSIVDGIPRKALELDGVADPPAMQTSTVKFAGADAVVTTRTSEDEEHTRTTRSRYRWNGTVYETHGSKRATTSSK